VVASLGRYHPARLDSSLLKSLLLLLLLLLVTGRQLAVPVRLLLHLHLGRAVANGVAVQAPQLGVVEGAHLDLVHLSRVSIENIENIENN
jgi:hypothetical protein